MSRYDPIRDLLRVTDEPTVAYSFEELADLVGGLPAPAVRYAWWWANEDPTTTTRSQCKSWQAAGFEAKVDMTRREVIFHRRNGASR